MTETAGIDTQDTTAAERPFLVREFVPAGMEISGRTVEVRLVPFGEVARVADPPDWLEYEEEWLPGVFDHQLNAANRIHARYGHSPHVIDVVGHGVALRSVAGDGYRMTATIHDTPAGGTTLELLRGGALPAVSLEARPVRSHRTAAGVVQRVKAHLTGFAFCRIGAFTGAQVLAVREHQAEEFIVDADLLPVDIDADLVERCRRLGIRIPQRLQAHPERTGTPSDDGTPADGTRPTGTHTHAQEDTLT